MKKKYVLDANALLTFLEENPGAPRVRHILQEAHHHRVVAMVSVLNWGEVYYHLWQERGVEAAEKSLASLSRLPLELVPVDLAQTLRAAEIKAVHKIPYVDCVAAALALLREAVLVTSDRDFEKLGRRVSILWITRS